VEFDCRRRTPRYPLAVDIDVTDIQSGIQIRGRTNTLSLFGCGVDASELLSQGASVRIKMSYEGTDVKALARVIYSRSDLGMGLAFTTVEPLDKAMLEWWIVEFMSVPVENT
jgi:PilZ domain